MKLLDPENIDTWDGIEIYDRDAANELEDNGWIVIEEEDVKSDTEITWLLLFGLPIAAGIIGWILQEIFHLW